MSKINYKYIYDIYVFVLLNNNHMLILPFYDSYMASHQFYL